MFRVGTDRSAFERFWGYVCVLAGAALLASIGLYTARTSGLGRDPVQLLLLGFVAAVALACISLGLLLASRSKAVQQIGCIGIVLFGSPTLMIVVFLVWSLFQTTRPATGP